MPKAPSRPVNSPGSWDNETVVLLGAEMSLAGAIVVLIFVRTDCPISNRYAPELQRLSREFSERGVTFRMVYPDRAETLESARRHAREYGLPGEVILDPRHAWVSRAGVHTTPEAAVFTANNRLMYHGRIDDRYISPGKARPAAEHHDLEMALRELLQGKAVSVSTAPAVGCALADLK